MDVSVGLNWSWGSVFAAEVLSSSVHGFSLWSGSSSGFFNLDLSSVVFSSSEFKGGIQGRSETELDKGNTFWFSIRSHEEVEVKDFSTRFEQRSDIGIKGIERKSLNTDFEFTGFIIFGVLNGLFYFLDGDFF